MNSYSVFIIEKNGGGTTYITHELATDPEAAKEAALRLCREDWGSPGEPWEEELHVLGVTEGEVKILEWEDLSQ